MKRAFDIVASAAALVILAPLFAAVAVAIKIDSRGPILFSGVRIGRHGRPFRLHKFRSMVAGAERISSVVSTPNDDPRITRVGRFLRRYALDELPQLFNVLTGEMSLVGPRPEVPQYVAMFTDQERAILSVRPGVTDWATVWVGDKGRVLAGSADPERDYLEQIRPHKLTLQLEYVRNHSFWIDTQILARTFSVLLGRFRS